ncbi:glycosyltransferase family 2 protein [Hoeflea sp.]|uniref:glycosyltransferase family 2 protein n=1 Tax=Hoeflea sp. TaxID=1940281 RepID=UPI003B523525
MKRNQEQRFFIACGIGKPHVEAAGKAALENQTTVEQELIAQRLIDPELYYRWLASELGLPYVDRITPEEVVRLASADVLLCRNGPVRLSRPEGQVTVISPEARHLETEKARLEMYPALRRRLVVASPATIRRAVWQSGDEHRIRQSTFALDQDHGSASARRVLTGAQGFVLALILCSGGAAVALWPFASLVALHVMLTVFFSGGILLRLAAIVAAVMGGRRSRRRQDSAGPPPVYTLLIALRDEAAMVPALVARISALDWPKSRLDVKYICEYEDTATIAALEAQNLGPECEIVRVPDFGPRTKPKALQYALQGARGSLVAVYDAEDKPAPGQLREAWMAFSTGDARLGCLQAPLAIANIGSNWLSGLFALEYSGLFRVLIPFLARTGMPIPLGGTSNHFRREALVDVGGWDPHNVTEDADLGLRLYANGYRTGIIRSATVESSPVELGVWLRQRTRWLKGWAQTWLVVMRSPSNTFASLGAVGFTVFQLMIAGMLVSALAHPLMFAFIALTIVWLATGDVSGLPNAHAALMWLDVTNILGSYLIFGAIGWYGFTAYEKARIPYRWLLLAPVYWLLMSCAGWRALAQLARKAHLWEKTPHPVDPAAEIATVRIQPDVATRPSGAENRMKRKPVRPGSKARTWSG